MGLASNGTLTNFFVLLLRLCSNAKLFFEPDRETVVRRGDGTRQARRVETPVSRFDQGWLALLLLASLIVCSTRQFEPDTMFSRN